MIAPVASPTSKFDSMNGQQFYQIHLNQQSIADHQVIKIHFLNPQYPQKSMAIPATQLMSGLTSPPKHDTAAADRPFHDAWVR